jgi:hypothetical protein
MILMLDCLSLVNFLVPVMAFFCGDFNCLFFLDLIDSRGKSCLIVGCSVLAGELAPDYLVLLLVCRILMIFENS